MKEIIKTFEYSNAKITVHIPELSQEERSRRMKILMGATQGLLMDLIKKGQLNNDKITKSMER